MPLPSLEDFTPALDRVCVDVLGDTILYRAPEATEYVPLKAHPDYRDAARAFENAQTVAQDMTLNVLMADVPVRPADPARVQLPKVPGVTFRPISARRDESGTGWDFELQRVVDV